MFDGFLNYARRNWQFPLPRNPAVLGRIARWNWSLLPNGFISHLSVGHQPLSPRRFWPKSRFRVQVFLVCFISMTGYRSHGVRKREIVFSLIAILSRLCWEPEFWLCKGDYYKMEDLNNNSSYEKGKNHLNLNNFKTKLGDSYESDILLWGHPIFHIGSYIALLYLCWHMVRCREEYCKKENEEIILATEERHRKIIGEIWKGFVCVVLGNVKALFGFIFLEKGSPTLTHFLRFTYSVNFMRWFIANPQLAGSPVGSPRMQSTALASCGALSTL